MFQPVYFDHNATTGLHPQVLEAMMPWLSGQGSNPSSRHEYGRAARQAVDAARQQVANALGAHPTEVIFTSGGSEANNFVLKGFAEVTQPGMLAISAIEHPSVLRPAEQLIRAAQRGWLLKTLLVDTQGCIRFAEYEEILAGRPKLVSIMLANNETGVIQNVAELAQAAKRVGALFHTDAVQAFGKIPVNFRELNVAGVNALTVSGHKIYGPQGIGALVLDKRYELNPLIAGGGQERGLRSGTEIVAAIVGFGAACERFSQLQVLFPERDEQTRLLRENLERRLLNLGATIFGNSAKRLPNTSFFAFSGIDGETLVGKLDRAGFAVASGSACSSAQPETSHVLKAMGVNESLAQGAVRVSLGESNTDLEVEQFLETLQKTLSQLRTLTAVSVSE